MMRSLQQEVSAFTHSADVVVVGGGTAGCAAALAAAREGASVVLLEEMNALGGVSTVGGVNEWFASLDGLGSVFDEIREEMKGAGVKYGRFFNGEYLKVIWQELLVSAGVKIFFHTSVHGVEMESGVIQAVRASSCSQSMRIRGKYFVDASGEGDLCAMAGAPFVKGHAETGRTLHMTLTFLLVPSKTQVVAWLPKGLTAIASEKELPGLHADNRTPDGRIYCNMTKVMGMDPTDPESLSQAELEARRQMIRVVHFLQRTRYPEHMLVSSGAKIGIREGRRIVGEYELCGDDILRQNGKSGIFADGVTVGTCQIDFHSLTKAGHGGWREKVEPYGIPYRCLIPKSLQNVLLAGKCISGDQVAMSSYRMTPTCCSMGQAAGTAVAMAVREGLTDVRAVEVEKLRAVLMRNGVELDPARHKAFFPEISADATRGA